MMIDPGNSQKKKEIGEAIALEQSALPQQEEQASDNGTNTETQHIDETVADAPVESHGKKRVKKVQVQPSEEELTPHPSIWPFVLALSVAVMLGGFAFQPILFGIGVIMVIVSVIAWNLERR